MWGLLWLGAVALWKIIGSRTKVNLQLDWSESVAASRQTKSSRGISFCSCNYPPLLPSLSFTQSQFYRRFILQLGQLLTGWWLPMVYHEPIESEWWQSFGKLLIGLDPIYRHRMIRNSPGTCEIGILCHWLCVIRPIQSWTYDSIAPEFTS